MALEKTRTRGIYKAVGKKGQVRYRLKVAVQVPDPTTGGVRWKGKVLTFRKEKDAIAAKFKIQTDNSKGAYVEPTKLTVAELIEKWIAAGAGRGVTKKGPWKPQTGFGYAAVLKRHIAPTIGDLKASKVTKLQLERAAEIWKQATSPATANGIMSNAVASAYKWALRNPELGISRNPVLEVQPLSTQLSAEELEKRAFGEVTDMGEDEPDRKPGKLRAVDPSEVYSKLQLRKIIEAAEPGLEKCFVMLAALCGLRHGEILGLRWSVINFTKRTLTVNRSMAELSKKRGGQTLQNPKTKSSYRQIPLAPPLATELKRWRMACPPNEMDLVFVNALGKPLFKSRCNLMLKSVIERAKVERALSVHHLRHCFASQQLARGVTPLEVSHLMGHSNVAVTLAVYAAWATEEKSDAQEKLADDILSATEAAHEEAASGKM